MLSPLERDHILSTCVCFSKHAFTLLWLALEFFPSQKPWNFTWLPVPRTCVRPATLPCSHTSFSCNFFPKDINKSISCLSLCLPLSSFCTEIWRTGVSLNPETSCTVSVRRLWVQVPFEKGQFAPEGRGCSFCLSDTDLYKELSNNCLGNEWTESEWVNEWVHYGHKHLWRLPIPKHTLRRLAKWQE